MGWFAHTRMRRPSLTNKKKTTGGGKDEDVATIQERVKNLMAYDTNKIQLIKDIHTLTTYITDEDDSLKPLRKQLFDKVLTFKRDDIELTETAYGGEFPYLKSIFDEIYSQKPDTSNSSINELSTLFTGQSLSEAKPVASPSLFSFLPFPEVVTEKPVIPKIPSDPNANIWHFPEVVTGKLVIPKMPDDPYANIRTRIANKTYRKKSQRNQYIGNRRRTITIDKNTLNIKKKKLELAKAINDERFYIDPTAAWEERQEENRTKQRKTEKNLRTFWSKKSATNKNKKFGALKEPTLPSTPERPLNSERIRQMRNSIAKWNNIKMKERVQLELRYKKQQEEGFMRPEGWGPDLFDPKNGRSINEGSDFKNVEFLKEQCAIFNKVQDMVPPYPLGSDYNIHNNTTMYGVVVKLFLNPAITLDEMLSFHLTPDRTVGCDMYEVLCTLFVFLGGVSFIKMNDYKFIDILENYSTNTHRVYKSNSELFSSIECRATSGNGKSDVTLVHNEVLAGGLRTIPSEGAKKIYAMSVKYWAEEGSPTDYDISKLYSQTTSTGWDNLESAKYLGIIVFVKTRDEFTLKCLRAKTTDQIEKCMQIYGANDVKTFLNHKREEIFHNADTEKIESLVYFNRLYNIHPSTRI